MSDNFYDIRAQERDIVSGYKSDIDRLERAISFGRRSLALRGQPGYTEFIDAVRSLRDLATNTMIGFRGPTAELRILQGKVQALRDVIAIMEDAEKGLAALEAQLRLVKNTVDRISTPGGYVAPDTLGEYHE